MFPELVQYLGCDGRNIRIMAIIIVFVELQHILLTNDDILVDIEFGNICKPIWLDNKRDVYDSIETLYIKSNNDVTLWTYHKIDHDIL